MDILKTPFDTLVSKNEALKIGENDLARNIPELIKILEKIEDKIFKHHVSKHHNDFSEWILDNYGDEKLAKKISKCYKKQKIANHLKKALAREAKEVKRLAKKKSNKIKTIRRKKDILKQIGEGGQW